MMDLFWHSKAAGSPCSTAMLKPAFTVMGRPAARATNCRGGRSRLLGRCFTVSAQTGNVSLVTLALQCRADIEQRINGQSALDSASQAGQVQIAEVNDDFCDCPDGSDEPGTERWCLAGLGSASVAAQELEPALVPLRHLFGPEQPAL